jgi:hypothetical protein
VNAKAREVQNIDFWLFEVGGEDHDEKEDHPLLDLLDESSDEEKSGEGEESGDESESAE